MKIIKKIVKVMLLLGLLVYICMGDPIKVNASAYSGYSSNQTSELGGNLLGGREKSSNSTECYNSKRRNDPLQNLIGIITLAGICGFILMGFYDDNH